MTPCSNCRYDPVFCAERCVACYHYWRRHKRKVERPYSLVIANGWRRWERHQGRSREAS